MANLNNMYRHDDDKWRPPHKQSRSESAAAEAEATTPEEPIHSYFGNICYELLERILDELDLESLLDVAGTCKRFQTVAAAKFCSKYGRRKVIARSADVYGFVFDDLISEPYGSAADDPIYIMGLKKCLPFLRCFGAKISSLDVSGSWPQKEEIHLNRYINQYCYETCRSNTVPQ